MPPQLAIGFFCCLAETRRQEQSAQGQLCPQGEDCYLHLQLLVYTPPPNNNTTWGGLKMLDSNTTRDPFGKTVLPPSPWFSIPKLKKKYKMHTPTSVNSFPLSLQLLLTLRKPTGDPITGLLLPHLAWLLFGNSIQQSKAYFSTNMHKFELEVSQAYYRCPPIPPSAVCLQFKNWLTFCRCVVTQKHVFIMFWATSLNF